MSNNLEGNEEEAVLVKSILLQVDAEKALLSRAADYLGYLSLLGVERAGSGHPGLPLGCSLLGAFLYRYALATPPAKSRNLSAGGLEEQAFNVKGKASKEVEAFISAHQEALYDLLRDRFVLSAGHGSMLLYGLNYLFSRGMKLQDIENFRQLGYKSPGHPEYNPKDFIETTTGPLGQGFANAVGMAIEQNMLMARLPAQKWFYPASVFTLLGDGCMMEGVSYEAASLAGHLGLENLVAIYDSNSISIDGRTNLTFTENVAQRFKAMGWQVYFANGRDIASLQETFLQLRVVAEEKGMGRPKLIIMKTVIGEGLLNLRDTAKAHGSPAGLAEIAYFLKNSALAPILLSGGAEAPAVVEKHMKDGKFPAREEVFNEDFLKTCPAEKIFKHRWQRLVSALEKSPQAMADLATLLSEYSPGATSSQEKQQAFRKDIFAYSLGHARKAESTRKVSSEVLQLASKTFPNLIAGSADLVASTLTKVASKDEAMYISRENFQPANIAFGIREHAMAAIGNGLALGARFIPLTSTFLVFSDYMRPAIRLAALMQLKQLFVFTHDSFFLGEDGPTHQPVEHCNALRLIPNLLVFRPANEAETAFAYLYFFEHEEPASLLLTRQKLGEAVFWHSCYANRELAYESFQKGAYILEESKGNENSEASAEAKTDIVLVASGSELTVLSEVKKRLESHGFLVRLVSMPCVELLHKSGESYQQALFLTEQRVPVYFLEAAAQSQLNLFYKDNVFVKGFQRFGESAKAIALQKHFLFDAASVYDDIMNRVLVLR